MKGRLVAFVGVLCVVILFVSGAYADKPPKPPKPEKPGEETTSEWIAFTGDLTGGQVVEGCCPNAGPFPAYSMSFPYGLGYISEGTYSGHIFMNNYGAGKNQKYIVQFFTEDFGIEVIGGVIDDDKKNKVLTVTFTNEPCTDFVKGLPLPNVSFVLVRTSDDSSGG